MTIEETQKITNKIKIYRPKFEITAPLIEEYYKVFEPYDYQDVEKKLNEYLSDANNQNRYPDPLYLTKYLKTSYQKEHTSEPDIICDLCCRSIKVLEYKTHRDKCSSAMWLCDMSRKYFNKTLNYMKLMEIEQSEFDEKYYQFSKKLYEILPNGLQKRVLENYIRSYEGKPIRDDVIEEICDRFGG